MHLAVIICIILAVIGFIISIIAGIKAEPIDGVLMFILLDVIIVGLFGFGAICTSITFNTTYTKLSPDKVETYIFNDGIIVSVHEGVLYNSREIEHLNAINNIDYYKLEVKYNAYNISISNKLYPIKKGEENDSIKEK